MSASGCSAILRHRPWLLIVIIFLQATVYLCGPIASVWNLWAVGVPAPEYQRRFDERRLRAQRRRWAWARWHHDQRPSAPSWLPCALGGVTAAFLAPVPLLQATAVVRRDVSPQSLLAGSASTQVYLKLDSPASGAGRAYYFITSVHLSTSPAGVRLRFGTSSLVLLGEVLRAAAAGGRISHVSLAFRTPGLNGLPTTEFVDTFGAAAVTSFREYLSGTPAGTVSLALPAVSHVLSTPGPLRRVGPFAGLPGSSAALPTKVYVTMGAAGTSYAVSAVELYQAASRAPLDLRFTTSSVPLLDGIFRDQGAAISIPAFTLSVRAEGGGRPSANALTYTFSSLSVGSFAENLSGSLSGTATLAVRPR